MFMIDKPRQSGLSLIEMMIGLSIGLIIVAAAMSVYVSTIQGQADNTKITRLNQDLRAMMDIMVRDIRRAGFVTSAPSVNYLSLQANPFFNSTTSNATTDITIHNSATCIVYSYNRDNDAPVVVDNNERLGFRLNDGGEMEMRSTGSTNENCTNTSWESITEPEVEIVSLVFTLSSTPLNVTSMATDTDGDQCMDGDDADPVLASPSCASGNYGNGECDTGESCNICTTGQACLYVRKVSISMTGRLRDDPNVTQTVGDQIKVRNDKFVAIVP